MQFLELLMQPIRRCWLLALAALVIFSASVAADNPTPVTAEKDDATPDRIARLIEQLGSEDFGAREKAQSELAQAGLEAYDALHAAQAHHDPEIALRARYLVRSMTGSVRWFADSDSPKVVALLKEYGDLPEADKKNRIDGLAALEDRLGVTPLIRLARFETSDPLAKYAALQLMELPEPSSPAAKAELAKSISSIVGSSKRSAAVWLRLYCRTLSDPASTLTDWDQATREEHILLEKNPDRSSREIVRDFYRFEVELLHRLDRDKEANDVVRRTFTLIDGTPDQIQEAADWLTHREAWGVALELMHKFDAAVQENAKLLYRLAAIYDSLNQSAEADKAAGKALAIKPESAPEHLEIARRLEDIPRLSKWAEAEYRQVLTIVMPGSQHDFTARFKLAELLHDRLQDQVAAQTLKPVIELLQKEDNATAKETWGHVTDALPAEGLVARYNFFSACHFHDQGDYVEEKKHLKAAADAYFRDADVLIAMYRLPHADDAWKAMTKEKIELVAAEYYRDVEEHRINMDAADDERSKQVTMQYYAHYCNQYAWLIGNTFGDYQQALKLSQDAVKICQQLPEIKSNLAGYLDTLGRAYYGAGDVANAVKHQTMAVELNPVSGQIRRQLDFFRKEARARGIRLPESKPQ
jgi:tetratricopeptide (TPR) repeat protein